MRTKISDHSAPAEDESNTELSHEPPDSPRNFLLLASFQIVLRIGWIFKTESIIMPAVLDYLGGGGMIRGWLPLANRICQSIPTMILAPRLRSARHKKRWLCAATLMMGVCFGVLSICFTKYAGYQNALQIVFIALYGLFFVATGLNQVIFSTLQGKLIPANRRGRLLLTSNLIGVVAAVGAVWWLLPGWLSAEGAQFQWLFATSSIAFLIAGLLILFADEVADEEVIEKINGLKARLREAFSPFASDANFRRLCLVAALFGASIILFPHYQALGRGGQLGGDFRSLLLWLTVQNIGTAVFSMIVGPTADRRGNRAALKLTLTGIAAAPLLAILCAHFSITWAFPVVFVLVGLTPVVIRLLMNYTLEVSPAEKHPAYLAAVTLMTGAPVLLSPLAGSLVDLFGFAPIFLTIFACCIAAWIVAGRLHEPRFS